VLDILPASIAASTRSVAQPIHVGDMRLADLRRLMNTNGHSAEFRGEGTLLVDGIIAVKKLSSGKIIVEGVPVNTVAAMTTWTSDSFTRVRRQIYEGLAVVAAG
jgi:cleavage and polyadenylation specificity factor subunit 2